MQPIQTRGVVDQWTRDVESGTITPLTPGGAIPAAVAKNRLIDSLVFDNQTGGSITVTLYHKADGVTAPGVAFYKATLLTLTTLQVPVTLPNLPAGDAMYALASATALHYLVNFRTEN